MASRLPQGLLTNSRSISGNIERVDRVAIEDISRLWLVYSTNKAVLTHDVGFRLENFFWRIWGNESIYNRITGSQVALIFNEISQGRPIGITPTSSPPIHRIFPSPEKENSPRRPTPSKPTTIIAAAGTSSSEESEYGGSAVIVHDFASQTPQKPVTSQSPESSRAPTRLPPILKKSDPVSALLSKSARLQSPPAGLTQLDDEPQSARAVQGLASRISLNSRRRELQDEVLAVRRTSDEMNERMRGALPNQNAASPALKSRIPENSPIQGASKKKKKTVFLASTTTGRKRPSGIRRKSSQSSSGTTSKDISPGPAGHSDAISISSTVSSGNPIDATGEEFSSSADFLPGKTKLNTITNCSSNSAKSPTEHPFRRERPSLSPRASTSSQDTATSSNPSQDALVSRDFRARFADRVPSKNVSFASLPTLAAKSKASVAALATQQASSNMPAAQKRRILKSGPSENMAESSAEQAESAIEDDEPEVVLSRTKSQLTLLLEQHRRGEGVDRGRKTSY